jgi:hypothetical protein
LPFRSPDWEIFNKQHLNTPPAARFYVPSVNPAIFYNTRASGDESQFLIPGFCIIGVLVMAFWYALVSGSQRPHARLCRK